MRNSTTVIDQNTPINEPKEFKGILDDIDMDIVNDSLLKLGEESMVNESLDLLDIQNNSFKQRGTAGFGDNGKQRGTAGFGDDL